MIMELDMTGYQTAANGVLNALIGTGQNGDAVEFTRSETRLLAMDIANAANSLRSGRKTRISQSVKRGIGSVIAPAPPDPFEGIKKGSGNTTWLMAGPSFLAGVPDGLDKRELGIEGALRLQRSNRGRFGKKKYREVGMHGSQHVQILDRFLVSRSAAEGILARALSHIGRLGASWSQTAQLLGAKHIPAIWKKHFPTPKNITELEGLANAASPSITFGSSAPGMGSPWAAELVQKSIRNREVKAYRRLDLILSGYAADHNSGRRAKRHAKDHDE